MSFPTSGTFVGRARLPDRDHPCIVTPRDGRLVDITAPGLALLRDLFEEEDCAARVCEAPGRDCGALSDFLAAAPDAPARLLAPADLQAIKAAGVTFVTSMLERVVEEQARGDKALAADLRGELVAVIGAELADLVPGSAAATEVRRLLVARGLWSQYLEVGIGPDAEIFTKAQPASAVGHGALVGLHPSSQWNNPEPELVLAVSSKGVIRGVTLGNDVNLRDIEGRSALLLGKAKDNNASAAIGPFVRLFDDSFGLVDAESADLTLRVSGEDGFVLEAVSSMKRISRRPADLVAQAIGAHHQYPDGFMLYLGTMFAPVQDRGASGAGFTHHLGDRVEISTPALGCLVNHVALSTECPPWRDGASQLLRALARNGLLE